MTSHTWAMRSDMELTNTRRGRRHRTGSSPRGTPPSAALVAGIDLLGRGDAVVEHVTHVSPGCDHFEALGEAADLILTKRPARMRATRRARHPAGRVLPNVWLGTSIESDRYTFRADHLRETPAAVRFLSLEPLLGPLVSLNLDGIDWVIVGGESGRGARPMHPIWVRSLRDRCLDAGVPFFFKQWGEWAPRANNDDSMQRVGKRAAGRELDGRTWDDYPA